MDPFRNPALHNAKLQSLLSSQQQQQHKSSSMPPPPAYHMVVDPHAPIPNIHSPYDVQEEDEKEDDDTPEITINAATQIRGHGNIISIAQMDSIRIANLVAVVLNGGSLPQVACPPPPQPQPQPQQAQQQRPQSPTQTGASAATEATPTPDSRQEDRLLKQLPKINITINCGATVLGDRNIVGPGLGDIARHMQWAQRNQAQHAQQQQQQQQHQHQQGMNQRMSNAGANLGAQYQTQAPMGRHGLTPPMSRSSSFGSEGSNGVKRKAPEDAGGQFSKRQC